MVRACVRACVRKCVFVFVFVFVFVCGAPKLGGVTASGRDSYMSTLDSLRRATRSAAAAAVLCLGFDGHCLFRNLSSRTRAAASMPAEHES